MAARLLLTPEDHAGDLAADLGIGGRDRRTARRALLLAEDERVLGGLADVEVELHHHPPQRLADLDRVDHRGVGDAPVTIAEPTLLDDVWPAGGDQRAGGAPVERQLEALERDGGGYGEFSRRRCRRLTHAQPEDVVGPEREA